MKRLIKRGIAYLLTVCMMCSFLYIPALASDSSMKMSLVFFNESYEKITTAVVGDTVYLGIKLENYIPIKNYDWSVSYDTALLDFDENYMDDNWYFMNGNYFPGSRMAGTCNIHETTGRVELAFAYQQAIPQQLAMDSRNITAYFAFTVKDVGEATVNFNEGQLEGSNVIWNVDDGDGNDIPTILSPGSLKCVKPGVNLDKTEVTVNGTNGGTVTATVIDSTGENVTAPALTVNPAEGGVTVEGSTITVDAKAKAGTYIISYDSYSANLSVSRVAEAVTSVTVSPASATITRPKAGEGIAAQTFTATVYNQYDEAMSGQSIQWSANSGEITDGVLTIDNTVAAGEYTVTATVSGVPGTADVTVTEEYNKFPTTVVFEGINSDSVTVIAPKTGETVLTFTATVYDQYGDKMPANRSYSTKYVAGRNITIDVDNDQNPVTFTVTIPAGCGTRENSLKVEDTEITLYVKDIEFAFEKAYSVSEDRTYGKTWGELITIGEITATLNGEPVEGTYSLSVDKDAIPAVGAYSEEVKILFNGSDYTTVVVDTVTYVKVKEATLTNVTANVEGEIVYIVNSDQNLPVFTATTVDGSNVTVTYGTITGNGANYFDYDATNGTIKVKDGTTDEVDGQTATIPVTISAPNHTSVERTITVKATKKNEVAVTFNNASNQTYTPNGFKLGNQFVTASVPADYTAEITYSYNGQTYTYSDLCDVTVTNAGTYTVIAYYEDYSSKGSATATFTIDKADVTEPTAETGLVYSGVEQTGVVIADNALYALAEDSSNKGTNAGGYTTNLTLKDTANYKWAEGSDGKVEWSIARKSISVPTAIEGLVYSGSEKTGVAAGDGYTISGNTATNAGSYTATATLDSNHMWTDGDTTAANINWSIARKSIEVPTAIEDLTYTGTTHTGVQSGEGYTIIGNTATNAGTYTATATPDSNHEWKNGTATATGIEWSISAKSVTATVETVSNVTYNGGEQKPAVTVKDVETVIDSSEYTVSYLNNTNAGTATVTITDNANGNYTVNGSGTFTIDPKTVSVPIIEIAPDSFTYTGEAQILTSVTVKDGETVIDASEYTVSYSNNTNAGTATVTITDNANGNYTVSGSKPFTINKADQATLSIDCANTVTYGQTLTLNTTGGAGDGAVTYVVTNGTGSATVNGNVLTATQAGSVTVVATKAETDNYKEISSTAFTITINPIQVAKPAADSQNYVYTGSEQTYQVTENDAYTVSNNKRTVAGSQDVTVALKDKVNYVWADNSTTDLTFTFEIQKQTLTIDPVWNASSFVYDKSQHEVSIASGVDTSKVTVAYENNTATNVGSYTATATFAPKDADNYSVEQDSATHSWGITKAAQQQHEMQTINVRYSNTATQTYTAEQIKALIGDTNNGTTITIEQVGVASNDILAATDHDDDKVSFALKSGLSSSHTGKTALLTVYYSSNNYAGGALNLTIKVMDKEDVSSAITFVAGSGTYNGQQHSHETATVSESMTGTISYTYEGDRVNKGTFQVTAIYEDADNYGTKTVTYTINPKSVAVVWSNTELTYSGTAQKPTAVAETGIQDETLTVSVAGEQVNASETAYTATATITNTNYILTNVTSSYTINPKSVAVVWTNTDLTYTGSAQKPTASVETGITGQTLTPNVAGEQVNASETAYTATASVTNTNYTLTNATTNYTINPKSVAVVWGSEDDFTYNGIEQAPAASVETGITGQTLIPTVTGKQVNASGISYTATATTDNGNYTLTNVTKEYTISPKPVDVVWTNTALTYNGSAQAPTAAVTEGIVAGDSVPLTVTGEKTDVGSGYIAGVTTTNSNYNLTNASTEFAIGKAVAPLLGVDGMTTYKYTITGNKSVTITGIPADAGTVSYAVGSLTGQTSALVGTPTAADGAISFTLAAAAEDAGKSVSIPVTVTMGNYADAAVTVTINIVEKDVPVVTVENIAVDYTGTALTAAAIIGTAKFEGTDVAGSWSWVTDTETIKTAGTYAAAQVKFTPEDSANYAEVTATITVTVNKVKVTVPSAVTSLIYNAAEQTGVVDGEHYSVTGNTGTNAGNYTATVTLDDSANYEWASAFEGTIQWSIAKANPTGAPTYTAINSGDKTLADAALTVGTLTPAGGTIQWVDAENNELASDTKVVANTAYKWLYTPADTDNYNTLSGTVTLYYVYYGGGSSVTTTPTPSASSTSPTVSTETTENEDGSTTVTETKKDGTVVETTTNTDGSSVSVETQTNGTVITTETGADGSTSTTAIKSDVKKSYNGTTTTTVTVATATDAAGTTTETETVEKVVQTGSKTTTTIETTTTTEDAEGNVTTTETSVEKVETATKTTTTTETTIKEADGTTTNVETTEKTVKNSDGTETTTSTIETTVSDGSSSVVTMGESGNVTAEVTISEKAAAAAAKANESVILPMPAVTADTEAETAPVVTVTMKGEATVVIPVVEVTPGTVAVEILTDGTRKVIRESVVDENGVKLTVSGDTTVAIVDNGKNFTDVNEDVWYYDAVQFVSSRELFNGVGNDLFAPLLTTSRAMMVQVLHNLAYNVDTDHEHSFDDVNIEAWYNDAINWANAEGIALGDGTGSFNPGEDITREQLVTILWRYDGAKEETADLSQFRDSDKISTWALDAMNWAVKNGVMNGDDVKNLNPRGSTRRSEAAQLFWNYCQYLAQ